MSRNYKSHHGRIRSDPTKGEVCEAEDVAWIQRFRSSIYGLVAPYGGDLPKDRMYSLSSLSDVLTAVNSGLNGWSSVTYGGKQWDRIHQEGELPH